MRMMVLLVAMFCGSVAFAIPTDSQAMTRPVYAVCSKVERLSDGTHQNTFTIIHSGDSVKIKTEQPMAVSKEYCLTKTQEGYRIVGLLFLVDPAKQSVVA